MYFSIGQIEKICGEFQGGTPLYVSLKDAEENITLDLLSRKMRVKAGNELVKEMRRIVGGGGGGGLRGMTIKY